ncbi:MAG: glycosyltransferase family 4 protein [Gemmatimonadota bacterium]|nr:glycosyltransferase family 4 protein [Gemmatimonadota bacterium]
MKRILFVDHTPFVGGAELVLAEHIRHLDRSRFTPMIACTPTVPFLLELYRSVGAEVHLTPFPRLRGKSPLTLPRLMHAAWRLRALVRREGIDLVVSNTARAAYISSLALAGTRVPLIWWVRDFLYGQRWFQLLWRVPRRIVCVSHAIRDYYGGTGDGRFSVVYVGSSIYRQIGELTEVRVQAERARWGIEPDELLVGFMGRLVAEKGVEDVVEAIAEVHRRHPHVKLLVVGTGGNQEGDVEKKVRRAVDEGGMSFVTFVGYQAEEALYYSMFDIFVLATRTGEAFATSVVQAMMAGKPVVATATGGTPEIVRDHDTGLLIPPGSPREMAEALKALVEDRELASRLAQAGRDYALGNNREEQTTAQAELLYGEVARG